VPERRDDLDWGIARDAAEMERIDDDWWLSLTYEERITLVAELSQAFDWSDDDEESDGASSGLRGADWGVRRGAS
jgi:hypothetical protein